MFHLGVDTELYTNILNDELHQTVRYFWMQLENIIFQHDNDPKHTSRKVFIRKNNSHGVNKKSVLCVTNSKLNFSSYGFLLKLREQFLTGHNTTSRLWYGVLSRLMDRGYL